MDLHPRLFPTNSANSAQIQSISRKCSKTNGFTPLLFPNEFGQFRATPANSAQILPIVFVSAIFGLTPPFIIVRFAKSPTEGRICMPGRKKPCVPGNTASRKSRWCKCRCEQHRCLQLRQRGNKNRVPGSLAKKYEWRCLQKKPCAGQIGKKHENGLQNA